MKQNSGLKISLAQWSLHRTFASGAEDLIDFASIARNKYKLDAIEFVSKLYTEHLNNKNLWSQVMTRSKNEGIKNLLIMVDEEGDLGNLNEKLRKKAVENHYKWVNIAKTLECHSIRVNCFGDGPIADVAKALESSLIDLCDYASKEDLNILIENHGLYSSNPEFLVGIIHKVDKSNLGTLPDFGNWCLSEKWGSIQNNSCAEVYDIYKGIEKLIPFARGLSAKSYEFELNGDETTIDYNRIAQIIKRSSYKGYIGIEFEGENLSEHQGILKTKALLEKNI